MQQKLSIGNNPIKMALLQTVPGKEFEVILSLKQKLEDIHDESFAIFKGFGSFDVIIIYSTPSFGYHLTKIGPIDGILKSNLFLCFPHVGEDCEEIFKALNKTELLGISLLKLDSTYIWEQPEIEIGVVRRWRETPLKSDGVHFLGTLGWNELVILVNGNKLNDIIDDLHALVAPGFLSPDRARVLPAFTKTYSFLNLNYRSIPVDSFAKDKKAAIVPFFKTTSSLCTQHIDKQNPPTVRISCKPVYSSQMVKYWGNMGYDAKIAFGKDDIIVKPLNPDAWSSFVSDLLQFRCEFQDDILSTNTLLRTSETEDHDNYSVIKRHAIGLNKFSTQELEKIFGDKWGFQLANDFYSLNQLLQNPIVGETYIGMSEFLDFIMKRGKYRSLNSESSGLGSGIGKHFAANCSQLMKIGAELRSYGTYGTIEEVTGRFSRAKGGAQRSIFAIEYLIRSIMQRLDLHWEGFVIAGGTSYYHAVEVINVPLDSLWDPREWWGVYHEIAHAIIDHASSHFGPGVKVINSFLTQKDRPEWWLYLLNELTAEVIGYEIGFLGDFPLFMEKLWGHLLAGTDGEGNNGKIETYIFRTFFTELYDGLFNKRNISDGDWRNTDFLFSRMIDHMVNIEGLFGERLHIKDKDFIAGKSLFTLRDLLGYAHHIRKMTEEINNYKKVITESNPKTDAIVESIDNGTVYWGGIDFAEQIIYRINQMSNFNFSSKIATILSFHVQRLRQLHEECAQKQTET